MKTIYKYKLDYNGSVLMPATAQVISTGSLGAELFVWAIVDSEQPADTFKLFAVYGTGHEITEQVGYYQQFIGTALMFGGDLVFHVFEKIPQNIVH